MESEPVVAEVDYLAPGGLDDAPHNVNGGIMSVEQAGRRDYANLVFGHIGGHGSMPGKVLLVGLGGRGSGLRHSSFKNT